MSTNDLCCGGSRSRVGCEYHDPALQPKPPTPILAGWLGSAAMPGCRINPCGKLTIGGVSFFANYCVKFDELMFDLNIQIEWPSQAEVYLTAMCLADLLGYKTRINPALHVVVQGFVDTAKTWWVSGPKRIPDVNGVGMIEYNIRGVR